MAKDIPYPFWESRKRLVKLGLIIPAKHYLSLDKNDPKRIAYELKLITLGIDVVPERIQHNPEYRRED